MPPLGPKKVTGDTDRYRSSREAKVSPIVPIIGNPYESNTAAVDRTKMDSVTSANRTEITNFGD